MLTLFKKLFSLLLDLLFPIFCLVCQQEKSKKNNFPLGQGFLCLSCWQKIRFAAELKLNTQFQQPNYKNTFQEIAVALNYDDKVVNELIQALKFKSISKISIILAEVLVIFWQGRNILLQNKLIIKLNKQSPTNIMVIPIPVSKKRLRTRGFNQSELIADSFCQAFNYTLNTDLKKIKNIRPQSQLTSEERLNNVIGAFAWKGGSLTDTTIILLDDVITTGATIFAAAKVLQEAGAQNILALIVAA